MTSPVPRLEPRIGQAWLLWALCQGLASGAAQASPDVLGEVFPYTSPNGVTERCVMPTRLPGAVYRPEDDAQERRLCAIDLHRGTHALCPKLFSTSPGTLAYDLGSGPYAGRQADFERDVCSQGHIVTTEAAGGATSYKMSVNTRESSATFANSSLIHDPLARYLDAAVQVPPAAWRSMDKDAHLERVARRGEAVSATRPHLKMLHAGWSAVVLAEQDPASDQPTDELFTRDRKQVCGVLLHPEGKRYGDEVNGSRQSAWGERHSRDFQQTAPFIALVSDRPLAEAVRQGLAQGHASNAIPANVRAEQVAFRVRELIDLTLLDHLLSQQDRIGNIDYLPHWVWMEGGKVRHRRATGSQPPTDIKPRSPRLIKRTELGGNDAGVRVTYANYTQRTGMLERIRHYHPHTYRQLMALNADFAARGPLHTHVRTTFGLNAAEFDRVAANVKGAAEILHASCQAGRLRFDVDPEAFLRDGTTVEQKVDCQNPCRCDSAGGPRPKHANEAREQRTPKKHAQEARTQLPHAVPFTRPPRTAPSARTVPWPVHRRARRRGAAAAAAGLQRLPDPHLVLPDEAGARGADPRPAARRRAEELRLRRPGGVVAGHRTAVRRAGRPPVAVAAGQRRHALPIEEELTHCQS